MLLLLMINFALVAYIERDFFDEVTLNWQKQELLVSTVRELPSIDGDRITTWQEMREVANENVENILFRKLSLKLSKIHLKSDITLLEKLNLDYNFRRKYNEFFYKPNTKVFSFSYKGKYILGNVKVNFLGERGLLSFIQLPFESEEVPLFESDTEEHIHYTGLLIDATSLNIKPILFPSIYTDKGLEVYSPLFVSRKEVVNNAYMVYEDDIIKAMSNKEKLGNNPFVISAIDERNNMDFIISNENARELLSYNKNTSIIKNAKVVVLISK